jgi:predicted AAA+ superfamily ATPase
MAEKKYKRRVVDQLLAERLEEVGAVLIEGPKWCGKTTTALQQARSTVMLANPEVLLQSKSMIATSASHLLSGLVPRLFDEWQTLPELWDNIRYEVDARNEEGQFILTGSAVPVESDKIMHTGTGRFAWITMRPMSLWESEESTGDVCLQALFDGDLAIQGENKHRLEDIAFMLCRGGWPSALGRSTRAALRVASDYYDAVIKTDFVRVDNTLRNQNRSRMLLRSLARLQGTQTSIGVIRQDMLSNDDNTLAENTVASYIEALRKIFIVEDMPAWSTNLRSKTVIRTSPTRYFVDPSIAVAAMGISPKDLISDLKTFGFLFEAMAIRDLRVYADALDAKVYHYRDKDELECDVVMELRNGRYALIEIKLGGQENVNMAAHQLQQLASKIDTARVGEPAFRMVLTAVGDKAFQMQDGTLVVPIGCLKP